MKSLVLAIGFLLLSACAYTHITEPLSTDLDKTELGSKRGESSVYSALWLVAWGDGGAAAAAKNGGIKVMTHMDREYTSVFFGAYTKVTTIVYGD
jgi:hypothetical protein